MNYAFHDLNDDANEHVKELARKCPVIEFLTGNFNVRALVDTGSEVSAISKKFYSQLISERIPVPTLPTGKCFVVGIGKKKSKPIFMQALISLNFREVSFDVPCLVIEDLNYDVILGVDFLRGK